MSMRKLYLVLVITIIFISACSAQKEVDNFIASDKIANPAIKIVISGKIPNRYAFKILRGFKMIDRNGKAYSSGTTVLTPSVIEYFNNATLSDTVSQAKWKPEDFKKSNSQVIDDGLKAINAYIQNEYKKGNGGYYYIYSASDFIESLDGKYGFFYISKGSSGSTLFSKVILYEKKNGNWEVIETVDDPNLG